MRSLRSNDESAKPQLKYPWNDLMFINQDDIKMDKNRYLFLQNNPKYLTNQLKMNELMYGEFKFNDIPKNTFCVIC